MYSRLFSSIIHSSIWTEPDHVRILFVTLLAIADREGFVFGSKPGLERAANIHYDIEHGDVDPWTTLLSPDPHSADLVRNPENEGRRIQIVDGGFRIVNYPFYRDIYDSEERRYQLRTAQRRFRAKKNKRKSSSVINRNHGSTSVSPSEAESDADTVLSYEKEPKNEAEPRAVAATNGETPNTVWELELMGELRTILPNREMEKLGGLWRKRARHCPKAVAYAIEDWKVKTPDQRGKIKNVGAWLTDRHARALTQILK